MYHKMQLKYLFKFCFVAFFCVRIHNAEEELFELTTRLDDSRYRFLFHQLRGFIFNSIGKTSKKTKGIFLQEKFSNDLPFPCIKKIGISNEYPESVHRLKPGGKPN